MESKKPQSRSGLTGIKLVRFQPVAPAEEERFAAIEFRYGRVSKAIADATRYPAFSSYNFFERAASPVIPFIMRPLTELREPTRWVAPQFGRVVPYQEAIAASNPAIGFRMGQGIHSVATVMPVSVFKSVPFFHAPVTQTQIIPFLIRKLEELRQLTSTQYPAFKSYQFFEGAPQPPVPPIRQRKLEELRETPKIIPSQYSPVIPFHATAAPANPVIPYVISHWRAVAPPHVTQGFFTFPWVSTAAPQTYPVIPFRTRPQAERSVPVVPRQSVFASYTYNPFATPVIPIRIGQWIGQESPKAFVKPQHFTFPYFQDTVAPANPVIPIRKGQWISQEVEPLKGIKGYQEFPWVSNEVVQTYPSIAFRTAPLVDRLERVVPRQSVFSSYTYNPYALPVISYRMGQWIGQEPAKALVRPFHFVFPYWQGVIPPAFAVIPMRVGQWISDQVQPLKGIQGYHEFPWTNDEITPVTAVWRPTIRPRRR